MLRIVIILSIAAVASSSALPRAKTHRNTPRSPVGECPIKDGATPVYLPDSEDCDVYYECSNGVPIKNYCTAGLQWNAVLNTCDFPENANCQAGKPKKVSKSVHLFSPVGSCPNPQGNIAVYLPDSDRCDTYYECTNGVPTQMKCPEGLHWNTQLKTCDYPDRANCKAGKPSNPFCPVGQCPNPQGSRPVYLPDCEKCKVYYECSHGVPVQNVCPDNLEWNVVLNVCDFPNNAKCGAGKPKKASKAIQPASAVGDCPAQQGPTPVYLPDDEDCSAFYECSNGQPVKLHCAPASLFDSNRLQCVDASIASCQPGSSK